MTKISASPVIPVPAPTPFLNRNRSVDNSLGRAWKAEFKNFCRKICVRVWLQMPLGRKSFGRFALSTRKSILNRGRPPRECFHKNSKPKQCFSTISMSKNIYIEVSNLPLWSFLRIYPEKKLPLCWAMRWKDLRKSEGGIGSGYVSHQGDHLGIWRLQKREIVEILLAKATKK